MARRGSPLLAVAFHRSLFGTFIRRAPFAAGAETRGFMPPSSPLPRAAAGPAGPCEGEVFARLSEARRLDPLAILASQPEGVANEHVGVEAGAARINPPSAVDGDTISPDPRPLGARLIAVRERRVAAAEISVALPQGRVRKPIRDGDRVGDQQRLPQRGEFADIA